MFGEGDFVLLVYRGYGKTFMPVHTIHCLILNEFLVCSRASTKVFRRFNGTCLIHKTFPPQNFPCSWYTYVAPDEFLPNPDGEEKLHHP